MKFLFALGALALGVSAQSTTAAASDDGSSCLADYIVTRCLETETAKVEDCSPTDYDCLCAAHEAVATCYNNCPSDPRAPAARQQVNSFCALASTSTHASATSTPTDEVTSVATEEATSTLGRDQRPSNTRTFDVDVPEETGNSAAVVRRTGGILLGIAGVALFL